MKKLKSIITLVFFVITIFFFSCQGDAIQLLEESSKLSIEIIWPTRLIPQDATDIAIFLSNNNIKSYKKAILINKDENNLSVEWSLYPGEYTISVISMQLVSTTSSGNKNFSILTGEVQKITLSSGENKNLSIMMNYINILANLNYESQHVFYITEPIPIRFNVGLFSSILKYSGGKLYFTYNNGFSNVTEYRTIYVSNTEELQDGYFLSIVYPDTSGYPSVSFDLSVYSKFTVSQDKIATDFFSYYMINEIKIEISNIYLGHLSDGTPAGNLNIIIQ